jgi:hypothetical protein
MRPSDLLYLAPPPIGSIALFLQEAWLAALVVAVVLTLLSAFVHDVHREGGLWKWIRGGIKTGEELGKTIDRRTPHVIKRRREKLEARQQRREYKERHDPSSEQLNLFPWWSR